MIARDYPHTVLLQPLLSQDKYGETQHGPAIPLQSLVTFTSETRPGQNGEEFLSVVRVSFPFAVNIGYHDALVYTDPFGTVHTWNPRDIRQLSNLYGQLSDTVVYS